MMIRQQYLNIKKILVSILIGYSFLFLYNFFHKLIFMADEVMLDCQMCGRGCNLKQNTPIMLECGHIFCIQMCKKQLVNRKQCPACDAPIKISPVKPAQKLMYDPKGNNTYHISVSVPNSLIIYKEKDVEGTTIIGSILKDLAFDYLATVSQANKKKLGVVVKTTTLFYHQIVELTLDQVAQKAQLVSSKIQNRSMNDITFNPKYDGGKSNLNF